MARSSFGAPHEIVTLAEKHLGTRAAIHYAPSIPSAKSAGVRSVHAPHLPESELVLVVYDATVFGSARDGFVITTERLCWKNLFEHPRQIEWSELHPTAILPESGRVGIAGGKIEVVGDLVAGTVALLAELAGRYGGSAMGPYRRGAAPAGGALGAARIKVLARRYLGELDHFFFYPAIPWRMLARARAVHDDPLEGDETVAVLYDNTVFGSAEEGFLITPQRLCWKNVAGTPESIEWLAVDTTTVSSDGTTVHVNGGVLQLATHPELASRVARLVIAIANEAQGEGRGAAMEGRAR